MNKADFQLEQGERQMAIAGGIAPSSCNAASVIRSDALLAFLRGKIADSAKQEAEAYESIRKGICSGEVMTFRAVEEFIKANATDEARSKTKGEL
jgi:hypothetical protein